MKALLIYCYCLPTIICLYNAIKSFVKRKRLPKDGLQHLLCCFIPIVNFWVALWFIVALIFDCAGLIEDLIYKRNDAKRNVL